MNRSNCNVFNKSNNLVNILRSRSQAQPDQCTYVFLEPEKANNTACKNSNLDRRARAIGAQLQSLEATGERVLLLLSPGLDYIGAFLGCLYAGAIAVPVYPPGANNRTLSRLRSIVSDAQPRVVLSTGTLLAKLHSRHRDLCGIEALIQIAIDEISERTADDWQPSSIDSDSLAFLQYTSGSTGAPKGVMVSHGNLMHNLDLISQKFGVTCQSRGVSWLPPYHDMGLVGGILQPLYAGSTISLMRPVDFLQQPIRWLHAIGQHRATISGGPDFAYELCVSRISSEAKENLDLSSWDVAFTGAEPVRAKTLDRFCEAFEPCGFRREAFYPCYGMAESTLFITGGEKEKLLVAQPVENGSLQKNRVVKADPQSVASATLIGCGQAPLSQLLLIVNPESYESCRIEQVGEIWVRHSSSTARGYWNQPEKTQSVFQAHLSDTGEGPFLRTGDLGFLQDGELFVTGRLKDLIIIRGRNYYPQDIELTVEQAHLALRPASGAAFSIDVDDQEQLVVVQEVYRQALRKLNAAEIIQAIRQAITEHHGLQVHAVFLLKTGSIPKTSSGKIQRYACKQGFQTDTLNRIGHWQKTLPSKTHISPLEQEIETAAILEGCAEKRVQPSAIAIEKWLTAHIAAHVAVDLAEISTQVPFASYGLDSVAAVSLSGELETWLRRRLSPTLVYDYPSITQLAQYLAADNRVETVSTHDSDSVMAVSSYEQDDIAIVGMGCRFPGANSPDTFWDLLRHGKSAVDVMSKERLALDGVKERVGDSVVQNYRGGFLEDIDRFDAAFFGISSREAKNIDPQQRWLLEVAWEALENAGQAPTHLSGSQTGVFVGISNNDYARKLLNHPSQVDTYVSTGNALGIAANRLSYVLNLKGPSLAVDTACSSSLVALHFACQSLRQRECDTALAGGVNAVLSTELTQVFSQAQMMAADGCCKTFDAEADGYVRSEGCGVVVLKRLKNAQANGDRILAVVRGSAINQDGRSNGLTAPNGPSQQAVIHQALANARVMPAQIQYVETHGTGTPLGDPIEVDALQAVLAEGRSPEAHCYFGSVKTNVGHLESAAGIVGLIKGVLALQHQQIPPHLNLNQINPHITLQQPTFNIATQTQKWTEENPLRFVGVSSFGFGGTNAHVVLEAAKSLTNAEAHASPTLPKVSSHPPQQVERPWQLLTLSAKTKSALKTLVQRYQSFISEGELQGDDTTLADICFTANTGRAHFSHRVAIATTSKAQLRTQLSPYLDTATYAEVKVDSGQLATRPKVAFLFTGQGSQYINMGRQLYDTCFEFRQILERCDKILQDELGESLLSILYPPNNEPCDRINQTCYTQPALFTLEYALANLWQSWGIKPDVVMGHSIGEYVAACVAGIFDLATGLKLISIRARLMQALPSGGKMVAVFTDVARVESVIAPYSQTVSFAAVNGPQSVVISGEEQAVDVLIEQFEHQQIRTHVLTVSHAFHSPLMAPMLAEFEQAMKGMAFSAPQIRFISNLTGQLWPVGTIPEAQHWIDHVKAPVQFYAGMQTLKQQECSSLVEIGPSPILLGMGRHCWLEETAISWLPSLKQAQDDWQSLLESLGQLYKRGFEVDWPGVDSDYDRQRVALPTYPFDNQRYWLTNPSPFKELSTKKTRLDQWTQGSGPREEHPLLGRLLITAAHRPGEQVWLSLLDTENLPYLGEHCLWGHAVLFLGAYVEMALAAAKAATLGSPEDYQLRNLQLHTPLFLSRNTSSPVQIILAKQSSGYSKFEVYSQSKQQTVHQPWVLHASATVHRT